MSQSSKKRHRSRNSEKGPDSVHSTRSKLKSKKSAIESSHTHSTMSSTKQEKVGDVFTNEAKDAMRNFVHDITHKGLHELRIQYNDMKSFKPEDHAHTSSDSNRGKCRYDDIPCWDATRVVIKFPPDATDDFIHANWVKHDLLGKNTFICCQGPKKTTEGDFWRMVWQEGVRQIIMLCRCQELGKSKCRQVTVQAWQTLIGVLFSQYWPNEPGKEVEHGGLTVKCEKIDDKSDKSFVHTKLTLKYGEEARPVDHRQWMTWPDKSVPKTPLAPFRLLQFARKSQKHPSIIHCSAGVGRTGTLVAIELIYNALKKGSAPNVPALVKDIRAQRSHAVQTEDQYVYCHYALMQFLLAKKIVTEEDIRQFCKEYEQYLKLLNDNGGKQLPMNATSPTTTCSHCTRPKSAEPNEKTQDSFEEHRTKRHNRKEVKASGESMKPAAPSGELINLSGEAKAEDPKPPITYARNDQPFVKVLATPKGQPAPAMVLPPRTAPDGDKSVEQGTRNDAPDGGTSSSPYKPAKTYTIQEVGGQRKIIYHPTGKPFIKTINAGPGQPQHALVCPSRGPGDATAQASSPGFNRKSEFQSKR